jgi:hypothetical protein
VTNAGDEDDETAFFDFGADVGVLSRAPFQLHGFGSLCSIKDGHPGFVSDHDLDRIAAATTTVVAELEAAICAARGREAVGCSVSTAPSRWNAQMEVLETKSRRLETEQRWSEIEAAYQRIQRDDPDGWADYLGELAEVTAGEPDLAAEQEWPEYNQ